MVRAAAGKIDPANDAGAGRILQIDPASVVAGNLQALQQEVVRPRHRVRDRIAARVEQVEPGHLVVVGQRDDVAHTAEERIVPAVRGTRQHEVPVHDATAVGRKQVGRVQLAFTQEPLIVLQCNGANQRSTFGRCSGRNQNQVGTGNRGRKRVERMFKRAISARCSRVVDVRHEVRQTIGGVDGRDVDVLSVRVRGHSPVALNRHQHPFASRPLGEVPRRAEPGKTEVHDSVDVCPKLTVIRHVDGHGQVVADPRFHPSANADRLLAVRLIAIHPGIGSQPRRGLKDREAKLEIGSRQRLFTQLLAEERELVSSEERVAAHTNLTDEPIRLSECGIAVGAEVPVGPQGLEAESGLLVPVAQRGHVGVEVAVDAEDAIRPIRIAAGHQAGINADIAGVREQQPRVRGDEGILIQPERRERADLGVAIPIAHS